MHACLITAPTITEFRSPGELLSDAVQLAASQPQLGILGVAGILERFGDTPDLLDVNSAWLRYAATSDGLRADAFAEHLAGLAVRSNADLYGFSSICSTYPLSIRVARAVKQLRPWATVLFGGPQASVVDVATLTAFPFIDLILRGEVEETLPLLLDELGTAFDLSGIGGLTWRDGLTVRRNPNAPVIEDLDDLLPPAYHLSSYLRSSSAASIELGRGCPFACTFCSTNDFFRRRFRLRSPAKVLADMRRISADYGIRHFELVHDMFTVDRKRVVAFCDEMLASGEGFTWDCSARTDCVDEELLDLMARSGCRGVFFGIESGSRRIQRLIDKDLDPDRAEAMLDIAERLGIRTTASLITGFPTETWGDVRDTVRIFMHSARCSRSRPQFNLLAPLAGTPLHQAHRHEIELDEICSDMSHQGLSQDREDLDLIRAFPDIFPNFYLIPLDSLDRRELFDMGEFLSMSVEHFRWLISAINQAADILAFYRDWRVWRIAIHGDLLGSDLRHFYVSAAFPHDFLRFLSTHSVAKAAPVAALLAVEQTLVTAAANSTSSISSFASVLAPQTPLLEDDLPSLRPGTVTLSLPFHLDALVAAVAANTSPEPGEPVFYATRLGKDGAPTLVQISRWLALTITACAGSHDLAHAYQKLFEHLPEVDPDDRSYTFRRLLEGAQTAGFVDLLRPASPATVLPPAVIANDRP